MKPHGLGWNLTRSAVDAKQVLGKTKLMGEQFGKTSVSWALVLLLTVLVMSLSLTNTWIGERPLAEYHQILREVNKEVDELKRRCRITAVEVGTNAPVEYEPNQEPFAGGVIRLNRGI